MFLRVAKPVRLDEIVDQLEMQFDEMSSYLDRDTGEVYVMPHDVLREVEAGDEPEHTAAWQEEQWESAKRIVESNSFVRLPTKWDVHEWEILREFAESVDRASIRYELLDAIHGSGAFRMFKTVVGRHRMESAWYAFRKQALRQIAIDWCEKHGIPWSA
ncbi:MAG: UPF0158 family protein [Acidobacteriota bacterium]|nr:UPF0158 family protein [Acidobacteriota bacterium]